MKQYSVNFTLKGHKSKINVQALNVTRDRQIASQLLPDAKIFNAIEVNLK